MARAIVVRRYLCERCLVYGERRSRCWCCGLADALVTEEPHFRAAHAHNTYEFLPSEPLLEFFIS